MYNDKHIFTAIETNFLGLVINNNISWKRHIECIKSKLSSACYAMRTVKPYVSIYILKMITIPASTLQFPVVYYSWGTPWRV